MGSNGRSFEFQFIGEQKLGFQKHNCKSPFFKWSKTIIPRGEVREHSGWSQLDGLCNLMVGGERKLGIKKKCKLAFF